MWFDFTQRPFFFFFDENLELQPFTRIYENIQGARVCSDLYTFFPYYVAALGQKKLPVTRNDKEKTEF